MPSNSDSNADHDKVAPVNPLSQNPEQYCWESDPSQNHSNLDSLSPLGAAGISLPASQKQLQESIMLHHPLNAIENTLNPAIPTRGENLMLGSLTANIIPFRIITDKNRHEEPIHAEDKSYDSGYSSGFLSNETRAFDASDSFNALYDFDDFGALGGAFDGFMDPQPPWTPLSPNIATCNTEHSKSSMTDDSNNEHDNTKQGSSEIDRRHRAPAPEGASRSSPKIAAEYDQQGLKNVTNPRFHGNYKHESPKNAPMSEANSTLIGLDYGSGTVQVPSHENIDHSDPRSSLETSSPQSSLTSNPITTSEDESTVSSEYEDDIDLDINRSLLEPLAAPLLKDLLSKFFRDFSGTTYEDEGSRRVGHSAVPGSGISVSATQEAGSSSQGSENTNSAKRKRKDLLQGHSDDEDQDESSRPPKMNRPTLSKEALTQPLMACPFAKWKPLSYHSCSKYIMKDIRRVKQHLRRSHKKTPYCPICWKTFQSEEEFYTHIQSRSCLPQPKVELEGVTAIQQEQLEGRVDRKLSKPDQWYSIYSILFPNCPRPSSPYLESSLSVELLSFQKFMAFDGLQIVDRKAREQIPGDLMPHVDEIAAFSRILFQQAIPEILRNYEATRPHSSSPDSGHGTLLNVPSSRNLASGGQRVDDWRLMEATLENNDRSIIQTVSTTARFPIPLGEIQTQESNLGELMPTDHQIGTLTSPSLPTTTSYFPSDLLLNNSELLDLPVECRDTSWIEDINFEWDGSILDTSILPKTRL
jgi:hypothetical protein